MTATITEEAKAILLSGKSEEQFARLKSANIDCVITDPPFGVDNQSNMATTEAGKKYARKIANDETPEVAIETFKRVMTVVCSKMRPESDLYIFTSYQVLNEWLMMTDDFLGPLGFRRKAVGIWEKQGPGMGDLNSWGMGMEFILFFKRGARERSDERRNFVLKVPQVRPEKLIHPHEKPAGILHPLLKHSSKRGDWVADPFAGSGSLLRAARQIGRNSIGCEYDKMNYDLAKRALTQGEGGGFDLGD